MLINVKGVKAFALEYAKSNRAHKFNRTGTSFIEKIEFAVRDTIRREVNQHPSIGATLK